MKKIARRPEGEDGELSNESAWLVSWFVGWTPASKLHLRFPHTSPDLQGDGSRGPALSIKACEPLYEKK